MSLAIGHCTILYEVSSMGHLGQTITRHADIKIVYLSLFKVESTNSVLGLLIRLKHKNSQIN